MWPISSKKTSSIFYRDHRGPPQGPSSPYIRVVFLFITILLYIFCLKNENIHFIQLAVRSTKNYFRSKLSCASCI